MAVRSTEHSDHGVEDGRHEGPMFEPPLYLQRYYFVSQLLRKHNITSVVDFGCAEAKLCRFLVQVPSLQQISLVDVDKNLLESNTYAIKPMASDYLKRREKSLDVKMFQGSVTDCDKTILGCDAVTLVELIEHLRSDVLHAACANIFGALQPSLVVMTTPNADFNQLFPGFSGMRHWDHKFEWTRNQFQQWCHNLTQQYGYKVEFAGIGDPPLGFESVGQCSQAAIFVRTRDRTDTNYVISNNYQLIAQSSFPYNSSPVPVEESLRYELDHLLHHYRRSNNCDNLEGPLDEPGCCYCHVPISYLLSCRQIQNLLSETQLRDYLCNHGYRLSQDGHHVVVQDLCEDPLSDQESEHDIDHSEANMKSSDTLIMGTDTGVSLQHGQQGIGVVGLDNEETWE